MTHRRRGHYEGDQEAYRDALADAEWQRRDPLARLQADAIAQRWLDEAGAGALEQGARAEVEQAVSFARASPFPALELAGELVYASER
jgi:pyruvate dehydrogenase E1 component alpha subunit